MFWIGTSRSSDVSRSGRQRERKKKKKKGLISKTTTSHVHHTFLYIPFPFFHDHDVKMPNFAFYAGRKRQATTKFYFSFWAWIILGDPGAVSRVERIGATKVFLWNSASGGFAYIWQSKWVRIIAIKTERTQIHFLSDVLVAAASLDLKVPIVLTWPGQSVYVEKRWPSLEGDSQKVDPARRVALLAKPTFRFSFKQFASFCKEM